MTNQEPKTRCSSLGLQPEDTRINSCSEAGFEHAWDSLPNNAVLTTYPPQSMPPKDICKNCGLVRTTYCKIERQEFFEYHLPESK